MRRRAWKKKCIQLMKFVHYAKYVKLAFPIVIVAPPPLHALRAKFMVRRAGPRKKINVMLEKCGLAGWAELAGLAGPSWPKEEI